MVDIRFSRVTTMPSPAVSNTVYFLKAVGDTYGSIFVTGNDTTPVPFSGGGGGSGTVTSVSVVTANGVSGSVANSTTAPAITLTLGAITPTSVAASGSVSGSNLSGTNTGDQTNVSGNAGTATALQNARTINGVSFNGTANITINAVDATARLAVGNNLSELGSVASARTNLGLGTIAIYNEATATEYRAATASRALSAANVWAAGAVVGLTDAATITVDLSTFLNASVTIAGNRTLGTPSNPKVGQSGFIRITQDATGSRTLAYGTNWKFAGGSPPVLSTAANASDVLTYLVLSTTEILVTGILKAIA